MLHALLLLFRFTNEKPNDLFNCQLADIDPKIFRNIQKYRKIFFICQRVFIHPETF